VFGRFFGVENRVAVFADGHARLHLLTASRTFREARRHVGPFAFDAERDCGAAVEIGNFAERMPARPHRVSVGDELVIVGVAPRGGGGEFFGAGAFTGADEEAVVVKVLEDVVGDIARGDGEGKAAIVAEIERVATRGDHGKRVSLALLLALRACGNVIDAVSAGDVPVLVGDGRDGGGGLRVGVRARVDEDVARGARIDGGGGGWCGGTGSGCHVVSFQGRWCTSVNS